MSFFQQIVNAINVKGNTTIPTPDLPSPLPGVVQITDAGITTLWITCGILAACSVVFLISSFRQPAKLRLFHHITFLIVATAAISYFCMANGIGAAFIDVPAKHGKTGLREVYYARYIDWMITTPLLLLDLALLAGIPAVDIVLLIIADLAMIATGLLAALNSTPVAKWSLYVLSNIFFVFVVYGLLVTGRKSSFLRSEAVGKTYVGISVFTVVLWIGYPIIWFLCEGRNVLDADLEVVLYAILDILAKGVFGFWLLGAHAAMGDSHVPLPESWVSNTEAGYGSLASTTRD